MWIKIYFKGGRTFWSLSLAKLESDLNQYWTEFFLEQKKRKTWDPFKLLSWDILFWSMLSEHTFSVFMYWAKLSQNDLEWLNLQGMSSLRLLVSY